MSTLNDELVINLAGAIGKNDVALCKTVIDRYVEVNLLDDVENSIKDPNVYETIIAMNGYEAGMSQTDAAEVQSYLFTKCIPTRLEGTSADVLNDYCAKTVEYNYAIVSRATLLTEDRLNLLKPIADIEIDPTLVGYYAQLYVSVFCSVENDFTFNRIDEIKPYLDKAGIPLWV